MSLQLNICQNPATEDQTPKKISRTQMLQLKRQVAASFRKFERVQKKHAVET